MSVSGPFSFVGKGGLYAKPTFPKQFVNALKTLPRNPLEYFNDLTMFLCIQYYLQ